MGDALVSELQQLAVQALMGRALRNAAVQGWLLYKDEILPRQEADVARQARAMLADGVLKTEAAGRLGVGVDKLNRLLGQYSV